MTGRRGFTLIELIVGLGLFTMVGLLVWGLQRDIWNFNLTAFDAMSEESDALKFVNAWANEVRSMQPAETGAYPLEASATGSVAFYDDYDGDGVVERVRYYRSGDILKKGITRPSGDPLSYSGPEASIDEVHDLSGNAPIFEYYDDSYDGSSAPLAQPISTPDVRLIKMTVTVDRLPGRPPGPIQVTTQVTMRNLKDNL